MSTEIKLDTSGWDSMLKRLSDKVNWKKMLRSIAAVVSYKDVQDHFKKEAGPSGGWKAWSEPYKKFRQGVSARKASASGKKRAAKQGKSPAGLAKILHLEGNLQQSFITSSGQLAGSDKGENVAVLINPVKYAHRHDQGTKGMPQRQFMWLSNNAMDLIAKNFLFELKRSADAV